MKNRPNGAPMWLCKCSCGRQQAISGQNIRRGQQRCGGCRGVAARTHGASRTALYGVWQSMIRRCECSSDPAYKNYGARGITVCARWRKSFEAFRDDMGPRPRGYTLERKNNARGYSPSNCKWASRAEQNRNTRVARILTVGEKSGTSVQWSRWTGVSAVTIRYRVRAGWPLDKAVSMPATHRRPEGASR